MAKNIDEFRKYCLELLRLTEVRKDFNFEEIFFIKEKEDRYLYYQQPEYSKKINELADYLLNKVDKIETNYSREYLLKRIDDFVFDLKFDSDTNKAKIIDNFYKTKKLFKENTNYIITRQIVNLFLDSEFSIGNVTFIPYSREKHESIYRNEGVQKEDLSRYLHQKKDENIGCIAKVEVSAGDYDKAFELSDFLVDESLDIIRLYLKDTNFGMRGTPRPIQTYATICDKKTGNMRSLLRNKDVKFPINLKSSKVEDLKNHYGLTNFDNILKKDILHRTDMEEKLIIATKYFNKVLKFRDNPEKIIRIFTGLETLLLDSDEEKKFNLAERLTYINHSDKSKRKEICDSITDLYKKRSKLVHNGVPDYKEDKFILLSNEAHLCIINIARVINKYPKFSDWKHLFETAKSSGKLEIQ